MKRMPIALGAVAFVLAALVSSAKAVKLPAPPAKALLAGTWIGPTDSGDVIRLVLDRSGMGELDLHISGVADAVSRYKVTISKARHAYKLLFTVAPLSPGSKEMVLSGSVVPGARGLQLVWHEKDRPEWLWVHALLIRERDLRAGMRTFAHPRFQSSTGRDH